MRKLLGLRRGLLRASARLLVLALSVGALGPVLHGVHADDCEPAFVVHDEASHHFQSAVPNSTPFPAGEHCVACHFARSSRGPASWELTGITTFVSTKRLAYSGSHFVAVLLAATLPPRAPPR